MNCMDARPCIVACTALTNDSVDLAVHMVPDMLHHGSKIGYLLAVVAKLKGSLRLAIAREIKAYG